MPVGGSTANLGTPPTREELREIRLRAEARERERERELDARPPGLGGGGRPAAAAGLSPAEAAAYLGVPPGRLSYLRYREGRGPAWVRGARPDQIVYPIESLDAWLAEAEARRAQVPSYGGGLAPAEAAAHVGLSEGYLASLRCKGGGPEFHRIEGGAYGFVRYRVEDLDRWKRGRG